LDDFNNGPPTFTTIAKQAMPFDQCHPTRGSGIKIVKKNVAPNAIFRVVSCLYILYDLTYSFWCKNSTHSLSYKVYRCFTVFVTSD
jgi:hypothetical protein